MKPVAKVIARRIPLFNVAVVGVRVPSEPFQLRMRSTDALCGCIMWSGPGKDTAEFSERAFWTYERRFEKVVPEIVLALEHAGFSVELDSE